MRSWLHGTVLIGLSFFLAVPVWAQQPVNSSAQHSLSQPISQADVVSVLNQALAVAGGVPALTAIKDYTASGTVTLHGSEDVQGVVTLSGRGMDQFRIDTRFPTGLRSHVAAGGRSGTKTEDGNISWFPPDVFSPGQAPRPVPSSDAFPYQAPLLPGGLASPYHQLAVVMNNAAFIVVLKGLTQLDNHSVYDVQVQRASGQSDPLIEYHARDYFIDASTYQLLMTRDVIPKHVVREIRYSDFRVANGILIPFSISEQLGGTKTSDIQLSQIIFNAGLTDASFALQ